MGKGLGFTYLLLKKPLTSAHNCYRKALDWRSSLYGGHKQVIQREKPCHINSAKVYPNVYSTHTL